MKLTAEKVEEIFEKCLFQEGEDTSKHVLAKGLVVNVGFHPGRLEASKNEIVELLDELPDSFKESGGGGMSFLAACDDKHGNQWTGEHRTMEQLFLLGIGIGKVVSPLPRDMWGILPGGVPYYTIKTETPATLVVV